MNKSNNGTLQEISGLASVLPSPQQDRVLGNDPGALLGLADEPHAHRDWVAERSPR